MKVGRRSNGARGSAQAAALPASRASVADSAQWPAEWLRGALEVCVLAVLEHGPTYGYAISASLEQAGLGVVKGGTLYPLLGRLEAAGLVEVQWRAGESGPGRKYYELNQAGRAVLAEKAEAWVRFTDLTRGLLAAAGPAAASMSKTGERS